MFQGCLGDSYILFPLVTAHIKLDQLINSENPNATHVPLDKNHREPFSIEQCLAVISRKSENMDCVLKL